VLRSHTRAVVVAHLYRFAGDPHQGVGSLQPRIVRMGCLSDGRVGLLVTCAIAVADRDEGRHRSSPLKVMR
jgi:hypothetical protein